MGKKSLLTLLGLAVFIGTSWAQVDRKQAILDSLDEYSKIAKPGWDQIDIEMGMARIAAGNALDLVPRAKRHIENIYRLSEEHDLPEGQIYGLVFENLIAYLHEKDADKAIDLCERALEIAIETNCTDGYAFASYQLAENYIYEKGDVEAGKAILIEALGKVDETVSRKNLANIYKNLGYAYGRLGEFDTGLDYLQQSLTVLKKIVVNPEIDPRMNRVTAQYADIEDHLIYVLQYIGDLLVKQGKLDEALGVKLEALEIAQVNNSVINEGWMCAEVGDIYMAIGNYNEAIPYLQRAQVIATDQELERDLAISTELLAGAFLGLNDYEEAAKFAQKNIDYYQSRNDSLLLASALFQAIDIRLGQGNLKLVDSLLTRSEGIVNGLKNQDRKASLEAVKGKVANQRGQYQESIAHNKTALRIFDGISDSQNVALCEFGIAGAFYSLGQLDSAQVYNLRSQQKAQEFDDRDLMRRTFLLASEILEEKRDYESALNNYKTFFAFNDSIFTTDAQLRLREEQVRQNIEEYKEQKELADLNAQLLEDRNQMYGIAAIVLFVVLLLIALLYTNLVRVKKKIEHQNQQLFQLNQTKDKFFGIIAHDLRSPLLGLQTVGEQIDFFLKKGDQEKLHSLSKQVEETTGKLTDLLDNLLNWALLQNGMIPYHPKSIDLNRAVESVFALLLATAQMKEINLINKIEEEVLVYADEKAINTILRNLISNALKYTGNGGEVSVSVDQKDGRANVVINDTGTGIAAERLEKIFHLENESSPGTLGEKGTGLGLVLCKELVELNHGKIEVSSNVGKGSKFSFNLPTYSEAA